MNDPLSFLITMCFGVFLWAIVGHGIWVFFKAVAAAIFGKSCGVCQRRFFGQGSTCVGCKARVALNRDSARSNVPNIAEDVAASKRLIALVKHNRWLDDEQLAGLERMLQPLQELALKSDCEPQGAQRAAGANQAAAVGRVPELAVREAGSELPLAAVLLPATDRLHPQESGQSLTTRHVELSPSSDVGIAHLQLVADSPAPPVHALEVDYGTDPLRKPTMPIQQRLTSELLKSFMEQSNIRWVELISAALIVICSVGLVISLWSTLSSTSRFFPSLVFMLATIAVHGAGQYTLRQWKLRATSRGILHIGLMLIPLAVLVGILLSRRSDGISNLDAWTVTVLSVGTLVYGALAVTASWSLFKRRWLVPAVITVVAALTIVPIQFVAERQLLQDSSSAWILVPLMLVSMWSAISMTRSGTLMYGVSRFNLNRFILGVVIQSLFAALVPVVFWGLQSRSGGISAWWWVATGIMAATWSSWGWSASSFSSWGRPVELFKSKATTRSEANNSVDNSWFSIAAWLVASLCSLFLLAAIWQTGSNRLTASVLLFGIAAWWIVQGWSHSLRVGLIAGGVALSMALAFTFEYFLTGSPVNDALDWIGLQRISILTSVGVVLSVATAMVRRPPVIAIASSGQRLSRSRLQPSLFLVAEQLKIAGGLVVGVAAILTLVAIFLPVGATPYGGNWAAILLISYGLCAVMAGIISARSLDKSEVAAFLVPTGQALLLVGSVRLCQTSPLLEMWLIHLRPMRSWAVGTALLSVLWSMLAAGLQAARLRWPSSRANAVGSVKNPDYQQLNIDWLSYASVFLAFISASVIWFNPDQLLLAARLGWYLPLTCIAFAFIHRSREWREIALLTFCLWTCSTANAIVQANATWSSVGLAAMIAIFVAVAVATLSLFEFILNLIYKRLQLASLTTQLCAEEETTENSVTDPQAGVWLTSGQHWGSTFLLLAGWVLLTIGLLGPFVPHVRDCLVSTNASQPNAFQPLVASFLSKPLSISSLVVVLLSASGLTLASAGYGQRRSEPLLQESKSLVILILALAAGAYALPPFSLVVVLWILAAILVASELLQFVNFEWASRSVQAWQRLVNSNTKIVASFNWLHLSRGIAVALLVASSLAVLLSLFAGTAAARLMPENVTWSSNLAVLSLSLGPVLGFGVTRWLFSNWNGEQPRVATASALLVATFGAAVGARSLVGWQPWPSVVIVGLQSLAMLGSGLAWCSILFISGRNFVGLRQMLGGKIGLLEIAQRSLKGARWQRCEKSVWTVAVVATLAVAALCVGAAFFVTQYPIEHLLGFDRMGGLAVVGSASITLALYWFLSARRGASHFGMLATTLAMLAPLGAAAYANWLVADPARSSVGAKDFEPYRMLVVLWLTSLALGLVFRIAAAMQSQPVTKLGESAWIALAFAVGAMSLVSTTQDPSPPWAFAELTALALIAVVSGVVAGQPWRGHVAAIAAAAGVAVWWLRFRNSNDLEMCWNILWGPTWVALVAIVGKLFMQRRSTGQQHPVRALPLAYTVDQSVSLMVPLVSALFSFVWIIASIAGRQWSTALPVSILGLSMAGVVLSITRLWEFQTSKRGLAFYFNLVSSSLVLAALLCVYDELPILQSWLIWIASGLGAMAIIAGLLRELIREASVLGPSLKFGSIVERDKLQHALGWMPTLHAIAAILAVIPSAILVLSFEERAMRVAATVLPFIGALTILPIAIGRAAGKARYLGLLLIAFSVMLLFWADLPVAWTLAGVDGVWIFVQRAFLALVLVGVLYPALVALMHKREEWQHQLMHIGWISLACGFLVGAAMLGGEASGTWRWAARDATLGTKLLTVTAWLAMTARLLQFAVRPHSLDVLASDGLRKCSVYAAELSLAFLCASCYFHFPTLFAGAFLKWWPLVIFAIAMLSAAVGEWLRRLNQHVVADPIWQSSLLLPILPLSGVWWFHPEELFKFGNDWGRYSFLLLSASLFYGLQSWLRDSIRLRVIASLLTLCSFWTFLHSKSTLQFLEHPQFWLLPPALAVLLFVEFNRAKLEARVVVASRYLCVLIAYLSSTAEVFIKAFEGQLWQPMLLLFLALAGAAAGMILHIRAFLYCGIAFTLVALLGMVWHAQQAIGQVWPWWAFGIATGVSLIVLLGYFEKNRSPVLMYLERLKQWER